MIANHFLKKFPYANWEPEGPTTLHEAEILKLDSTKAKEKLGWSPRWSLETALDKTIEWHKAWKRNQSMAEVSIQQIEEHQAS